MITKLRLSAYLVPGFFVMLVSGCGTTYVDTTKPGSPSQSTLQPAIFFKANPELSGREPNCVKVLPFSDEKGLDKEEIFRKAFHTQLS